MRRTLLATAVFLLVMLMAIPLARYRTLHPCGMLERELVSQIEQEARSARERAERTASEYSAEAGELARDVGEIVEGAAVGLAAGAARARVRSMSAWECGKELWTVVTD